MLCGVTATLGSNPSATATAARPHWGRAVLLCLAGVPCCCMAVPPVLLVAPWVFRVPEAPAAVCAGGRRPAREPSAPRASLGASSRSPARPCRRPRAPQPVPLAASALALVGFSPREAVWRRVADVSDPRVAKFPSFGGGEVVVSGSAVPAGQGLLRARIAYCFMDRL